jgi:hypothetical protein
LVYNQKIAKHNISDEMSGQILANSRANFWCTTETMSKLLGTLLKSNWAYFLCTAEPISVEMLGHFIAIFDVIYNNFSVNADF